MDTIKFAISISLIWIRKSTENLNIKMVEDNASMQGSIQNAASAQ